MATLPLNKSWYSYNDFSSSVLGNLISLFLLSLSISKFISLGTTRDCRYNGVYRFIDDLYAVNEIAKFLSFFTKIYPKKLELKVELPGKHATFLDLWLVIIFWEFFILYQMFHSPQTQWSIVINNKNGIYCLHAKLSRNLRLRILKI